MAIGSKGRFRAKKWARTGHAARRAGPEGRSLSGGGRGRFLKRDCRLPRLGGGEDEALLWTAAGRPVGRPFCTLPSHTLAHDVSPYSSSSLVKECNYSSSACVVCRSRDKSSSPYAYASYFLGRSGALDRCHP